MYYSNDVYTYFGVNKLQSCWPTPVSKFDPSSFYNWEHDNLPIHDLEERTHLLWERLGFPTSSINGINLVVSADATSSCNTNVFTSISAALAALPEVLNYPVIVEVASFGKIGSIEVSNKIFGPRGSLEIINRNFSNPQTVFDVTGSPYTTEFLAYGRYATGYKLASSIFMDDIETNATITGLLTNYLAGNSDIPNIPRDFIHQQVEQGNNVVSSTSTRDARLSASNVSVFTRSGRFKTNSRATVSLAARNTFTTFNSADRTVNTNGSATFQPYEVNPDTYETQLATYDASCFSGISNAEVVWDNILTDKFERVVALAYGNTLDKIKISNCNGPVYIRNFTVDGGGFGGREYGIHLKNSDVLLENCSVARCTKSGLYADNSNVILTRGFFAYRNYGFNSPSSRFGPTWVEKIKNPNYSNNNRSNLGAGIHLKNSSLNFNSTLERDYNNYVSALTGTYGMSNTSALPPASWMFCLSRNEVGIIADNSKIHGGLNELAVTGFTPYVADPTAYTEGTDLSHKLICELNSECGMLLNNSILDYSGRLGFYGNFIGLEGRNSNIRIDQIDCRANQREAISLLKSNLTYNKDAYKPYIYYDLTDYKLNTNQVILLHNGTHLKLDNSTFEPAHVSSMQTRYGRVLADGSFGDSYVSTDSADNDITIVSKPAFIVDNNSKLKLIHPGIRVNENNLIDGTPSYGAAIAATNSSEVTLQGTSGAVTTIIGPSDYGNQVYRSGLYADNGSVINIQGPTVITQYAVDILVNNNSTLNITPHLSDDGVIDVAGFNLNDTKNHTIVELHSTRACLVANNNSTINMKDLGDYRTTWDVGTFGSTVLASELSYYNGSDDLAEIATYIKGGQLQFYPNPNDAADYTSYGQQNVTSLTLFGDKAVTSTNGFNYIIPAGQYIGTPADNLQLSAVTMGGTCVRAVNGSKVKVTNVHFPCGWWNPSSVYFDSQSNQGFCSRLFIWNIADLSQLDASYLSVSGKHPADASYFGPSGLWAAANAGGPPITTPNTSSVPILDYYGQSTGFNMSSPIAVNQGPFRLYFSVDPVINFGLNTVNGAASLSGAMPQIYAQGYQFSGPLWFDTTIAASSLYKSIYDSASATSNQPASVSAFIYAQDVVFAPNTQRVFLEESAANTFANAKHNNVGDSNIGKRVAIYTPFVDEYFADSANNSVKAAGKGYRSPNVFDLEKDN